MKVRKKLVIVLAVLGVANALVWYFVQPQLALANRRGRAHWPALKFEHDDYYPHQVISPFAPIVDPPYVEVVEADERLQPNELVLGVEVNGESRAYPINMLTGPRREIFNDALGGQRIAATW